MPSWGYSLRSLNLDPERTAIASLRDVDMSMKKAVEVCSSIKGLTLEEARRLLRDVIALRRPIPYRRYFKKGSHKRQLQGWHSGGYPVRVCRYLLKLLDSVEANAEHKGLDTSRLVIVHAAVQKGRRIPRYMPRAFGRATRWGRQLVHVEIAVREV